jgi:hypothetical protein
MPTNGISPREYSPKDSPIAFLLKKPNNLYEKINNIFFGGGFQ